MVQHGLNVDDPLLLPVDDPLLLPEREVHAEIGINWFLDQEIPKGGYVRIVAESLLWEERQRVSEPFSLLSKKSLCGPGLLAATGKRAVF